MKASKYFLIIILGTYLLLLIPSPETEEIVPANVEQFIWDRDSLWNYLELQFAVYKSGNCDNLIPQIDSLLENLDQRINEINVKNYKPGDPAYEELLNEIFLISPLIGACPDSSSNFISQLDNLRKIIKEKSVSWDLNSRTTKNLLYRMIYGGRAALEEIILQSENASFLTDVNEFAGQSITPSTNFMGVKIHSGDILVSRGGAPTSALIARANDHPGNFSHIAMVYVEPNTNIPYIIESHIEVGVTVSTLQQYIDDKKLRIMVLRLRRDMPEIINDGMIPHKAASLIKNRADSEHIPYDFEMDHNDESKLFCSEVVSSAYSKFNIHLWTNESTISSKGTAELLAGFGVRNFKTFEPSDLEYDPQVTVVAEWRDLETLYQDHVDNAAVDGIIEWVNSGKSIPSNFLMLPMYRVVKLYSWILNKINTVGPIPEGMSPEAALRHEAYSEFHSQIKNHILLRSTEFKDERGYRPPYWILVKFANEYLERFDDG